MRYRSAAAIALAAVSIGCGAGEDRPHGFIPAAEVSAPAPSLVPSDSGAVASGAPSASAAPARAARISPFPPPAVSPPVERTKKPNDGIWTAMKTPGLEPPALVTTILHPHKIKPFVIVAAVAVDLSRVRLELVAGTEEPESKALGERTGLIPPNDVPLLLAATNGGFKRRHGEHGMSLGGVALVPPKADACTFIAGPDGGYHIGTWPAVSAEAEKARYTRQSPACLVERGVRNPDVAQEYKAKKWGGAEDGQKDIRRSAYALSKDRETLYFVIGDWVNAESLADALVALGVESAMEFDINYSYTRFVLYDRDTTGKPLASSPLLPELKFSATEYWQTPSYRDFFYLAKR